MASLGLWLTAATALRQLDEGRAERGREREVDPTPPDPSPSSSDPKAEDPGLT